MRNPPLPDDEEAEQNASRTDVGIRNVEDAVFQRFRVKCAELDISHGTGFERAIDAWLLASAGPDILSQPPFNKFNPNAIKEFRACCAQVKKTPVDGLYDAIIVWIRNFEFAQPSRRKGQSREE